MLLVDACVCMLAWHAHIVWMCAHLWNNYVAYSCSTHVRTLSKFWEADFYFSIFNFVFLFFIFIFIWFRLLLDLFIHEVLLVHVYSLFSMFLLSFLQLHTKIRASHYLVNIMEEVQFVSSNIEKAFEQCLCMWSDVGGTQHETIYLLIIKMYLFYEQLLGVYCSGFFFW